MLLANSRRPPLEHPPGTHWPAPTAAMRSCARMRATSSLSATHKRALVRVYLESGECGCRRVAVVFLHHNTILKKHWRASEDTPLPLSPSARQLCAAEPQTLAWYVRPLCAPRRALAVQPRRRRRVARFAPLCALSGGIFLGYLSSKTMSSARSQPARAAPLGAPRCGAPPARGLPGRATATARPSAPSARARPTRKPAVAREPSLCGRRRLPALARDRVRRPYIPSSGGVLAPPSQGTCTLEGESNRGGARNLTFCASPPAGAFSACCS